MAPERKDRPKRDTGPATMLWLLFCLLFGALLAIHFYHKGWPELPFGAGRGSAATDIR